MSIYNLTQVDQPEPALEEDGDAAAPVQFEFIEEGLQSTSLRSTILDTLGSAIIANAMADNTGTSPSSPGIHDSPIPPLVIYYQKSADGDVIVDMLKSTQTESVVKGSDLEGGSNAIWIGKEVPTRIIDDITRGLLDRQIPIRSISHFQDPDSKTNIIQIGTSRRSSQNDLVTESTVAEFIEQHHALQTEDQKEREEIAEKLKEAEDNINRTLQQLKY
ncbi:hypothetical protein ACUNV4_19765 [Granulosicoccus sp. 3-233]|uniref:hypothetical protein n=1 Tax=Granulosicoccus sp. 3-233 TaxID=3417969 RepID=UPI003D332E85